MRRVSNDHPHWFSTPVSAPYETVVLVSANLLAFSSTFSVRSHCSLDQFGSVNINSTRLRRDCFVSFFSWSLRSVEGRCGGRSHGQRSRPSNPGGRSLVTEVAFAVQCRLWFCRHL